MLGLLPDPDKSTDLQFLSSTLIIFEIIGHEWFGRKALFLLSIRNRMFTTLLRYSYLAFVFVVCALLFSGFLYWFYHILIDTYDQLREGLRWAKNLFNSSSTPLPPLPGHAAGVDIGDVIHGRATWSAYWADAWAKIKKALPWVVGGSVLLLIATAVETPVWRKLWEQVTKFPLFRLMSTIVRWTALQLDRFSQHVLGIIVLFPTKEDPKPSNWVIRIALIPVALVSCLFFLTVLVTWLLEKRRLIMALSLILLAWAYLLSR